VTPRSRTSRPFRPGERVLLVDSKARRYMITLAEGGSFSTHAGTVPHATSSAMTKGSWCGRRTAARLRAVRPTLSDYILKCPRRPGDLPQGHRPITVLADIFPGARVLEAGVGSGAVDGAAPGGGGGGLRRGYEIREDFAAKAAKERRVVLSGRQLPVRPRESSRCLKTVSRAHLTDERQW